MDEAREDLAKETIAALATPPGRGGVGIIRVSGPRAATVAAAIIGHVPVARSAEYVPFRDADNGILDSGIALYFPNPHSFTGEDVLELQGHGGPVVMDLLLKRCLQLGCRAARAGEFSERAFLNGKMDLVQAEAVADLIDCASEQAARMAMRSLQGEFSKRVHELVDALTQLRMYVESAIDFPEEEIDFLGDGQVLSQLDGLQGQLQQTLDAAQQGQLMREGINVVIAGKPNAGKSTLLNALSGRESAIVTHIPGTTRDVLREYIQIDGLPIHIIDTAGLRDTDDAVEQEGVRRAWSEVKNADHILLVRDAQEAGEDREAASLVEQLRSAGPPVSIISNKIDITKQQAAIHVEHGTTVISLSAQTGQGIQLLRDYLKTCAGFHSVGEGQFMARRRHVEALSQAAEHLQQGRIHLELEAAGEILAEELRQAQQSLGEITGEVTADDLLGKIFSSFCIGK